MEKSKITKEIIIYAVSFVILIIAAIIFTLWFLFNYGGVPVSELPTWLWWLVR